MTLSIVLPCYNTDTCIPSLYRRLVDELESNNLSFEIIFIDDLSPQKDYLTIQELAKEDKRVKLIKLAKNFGQQAAITCGLNYSTGDWVVVMDADLQDRPEEIKNLFNKALEGYDIVFSQVTERNDGFIKKTFSKLFHKLFSYLTGTKTNYGIRNFGIYNRKVVDAFLALNEQFRGFALLVRWLGFSSASIVVKHDSRKIGRSSYNFSRGLNLAIDSWLAFSDKPLKLTILMGSLISFFAMISGIIYLFRALLGYTGIVGWTSLILSIWFLSGFNIFFVGLIGLYIGKVFSESKKRPHYIVDFTENV